MGQSKNVMFAMNVNLKYSTEITFYSVLHKWLFSYKKQCDILRLSYKKNSKFNCNIMI